MEVYIEVVILDNFFFDYCLIRMTSLLWLPRPKRLRLIASALCGTVYAVLAPLKSFCFLQHFACRLLVSGLMVFVAFGRMHPFDHCKRLVTFWIAAAVMAGCLYAAGSLLFETSVRGGLMIISGPPLYLILFLSALIVKGAGRAFFALKRCAGAQASEAKLFVRVGRRSVTLRALIDTGSSLHDPFSGLPIVLLPASQMHRLYPDGIDIAKQTGDIYFCTVTGSGSVRAMHSDEIWLYSGEDAKQLEAMIAAADLSSGQIVAIVPAHATLAF